jgi:hypothetical protein
MRAILVSGVIFFIGSLPAAGSVGTRILADAGPFEAPAVAAHAEGEVDWLDDDPADDDACTLSFAASELQHYLRRMTGRTDDFALANSGAQLPGGDVILVGLLRDEKMRRMTQLFGPAPDRAELGPEGYWLKSAQVDGRRVTIVAAQGRSGALYGAYDFLYRLGCRWLDLGELGEEVPRIDALPDMDVVQRPSFTSRGFLAWENRGDAQFLLWMARNRLNYWTLEQEPRALMHKLGLRMICGRHDAEDEFIGPHKPYPYDHRRFAGDDGNPRDPYAQSDSFKGDADGDGQLSNFEAHPEWYALVNGQRVPGIEVNRGTNYCTSNVDATAEFVGNYVRALVDGRFRESDIVRFWALDVGNWCECENCRTQGMPTDRYLMLVHRFCQELDKARAEGRLRRPLEVTFLAYGDVVEPPSRPLPPGFPREYCLATFYPIQRCYVHRLDDPVCTGRNERYRRQLAGWATDPARHYRGKLAVGEYYNVRGFNSLPVGFMHTMAADIPTYFRAGARSFDYMHVTTTRWGSKALTNYQMARQLWDVETDCEALWQDYFDRRYGAAASIVRQFYESLELMLANVTELKYTLGPRLNAGEEILFPNARLRLRSEAGDPGEGPTLTESVAHGRRCRELISAALAMELPAVVQARLREDEQCFTYAERTLTYYAACVQAFVAIRSGHRDAARAHHEEARRVADLLRQDTVSSQGASTHANAANALEATRAAGALQRLADLIDAPR